MVPIRPSSATIRPSQLRELSPCNAALCVRGFPSGDWWIRGCPSFSAMLQKKTRYEHRGGFFLRQAAPLHAGSGADKARKAHPLSSLTRNTLCSFGRHRRLALFLNRRPRKEKVRTAENLCGLQDGADCRNRTGDLRVTSALLYQLS